MLRATHACDLHEKRVTSGFADVDTPRHRR